MNDCAGKWAFPVYGISQNLQGRTAKNFNTGASESRTEPNSSKIWNRMASYQTIMFRTINQHESTLYVCYFFDTCTVHSLLFIIQPTNAQIINLCISWSNCELKKKLYVCVTVHRRKWHTVCDTVCCERNNSYFNMTGKASTNSQFSAHNLELFHRYTTNAYTPSH